jgi:ketosteroid isomerase-like protein
MLSLSCFHRKTFNHLPNIGVFMSPTAPPSSTVISELSKLEIERNNLLVARDFDRFAEILDDALVFVHANGLVQDKTALLALLRNVIEFTSAERSELKVRQYGNVAIMTGLLTAEVRKRGDAESAKLVTFVTQVWHQSDAGWKLASFQSTQTPSH